MSTATTEATLSTQGFSWRRVVGLFRPYRARVVGITGLVLVTAVLGVVNPLLIRVVFDRALFPSSGDVRMGLLWALSATMLVVAAVTAVLGVWQTNQTNRVGQRVLRDVRDGLYAHLHRLSLTFHGGVRTGELQSRIASDVGGVQTAVTTTLSTLLSNSVTFTSAMVAMFLLSWQLTLISLVTVPLFVAATRVVGARRAVLTREAQQITADMSVITQETLSVSGITLAKLFGRQDYEVDNFRRANEQLATVATRQQVIGQAFFTVVQTFMSATPVLVYLLAGYVLSGGSSALTAGTVVAFTTLQSRLYFPVARALETAVEVQSARALFTRIFDYLDIEPDLVEAPDAVGLSRQQARGEVAFDDVHLVYDGDPTPAVEGIDFTAAPGRLVAFVGPSGAGKSSILSLAARLYDPIEGTVTLDGIDLRQLKLASLADLVGFVTQESYLFAGTLRANIAYSRSDATDEQVEQAARTAAIHDRIMELPDGYATTVGERGFRLSGGERQRIAIARVILHDPTVLLLDEATSALDTSSERRIQRALAELVRGRTTLAVAHRLSTIQAADVIHVVDRGRVVESGTHDELLAHDGAYRALYLEQFDDGRIETRCSDGIVYADGSSRQTDACDLADRRRLMHTAPATSPQV